MHERRRETACGPGSWYGPGLPALDELMVAASAADVIEGSAADLAREAYERVKEAYDAALEAEREKMTLGGLHVIGTNLHDSRQIDDQLRGRAGQQGDPGSTPSSSTLDSKIFRLRWRQGASKSARLLRVARRTTSRLRAP